MDFNPAYNVSRQRIKTAKYTTMTFAYHSTTYLFNGRQLEILEWTDRLTDKKILVGRQTARKTVVKR